MVLGDVLMDYVYVLQHSYEWEHEGEFIEETKMIGVYATHENAERVIEYYIRLP
jgi:predicted nucleic-acid-binding protein